ncbi:MAG: hypothetical protein ABIL05_03065 [candidate division WOR-3 bacterium]
MTPVYLYRLIGPLTKYLPVHILDRIALIFADIAFYLLKGPRRAVETNLSKVFDCNIDKKTLLRYVRKTFHNYARSLVDTLRLPYLDPEEIINLVDIKGIEHIDQALKKRRGLILTSLHLGNWDLLGCLLGALKFPLFAVAEPTPPDLFTFYKKRREHTGIKIIPSNTSPFIYRWILKNNHLLGLIGDRDLNNSGKKMKFFNGWRKVPQGPVRLASALKTPVAFCYIVLSDQSPHRYSAFIEEARVLKADDSFSAQLISKYEQTIRKYPTQWFIFQSEWLN